MAEAPASEASGLKPAWTELNDLCSKELGTKILFATDDWFAAAENLLESTEPVWKEGFTEQGKWMDGWETRRKRIAGHDWCIIRLGLPGIIHGVEIATDFFTGNFAPKASIQAARLTYLPDLKRRAGEAGQAASIEQIQEVSELGSEAWSEILPRSRLGAGYRPTCRSFFPVTSTEVYTHLRLNIYPDGGVARLRVYGVCVPASLPPPGAEVDLAAASLGGVCLGYSNAHYGHPRNMIRSDRGKDMGDGWETARNPNRPEILEYDESGILKMPGSEWAIFRLGLPGTVRRIEVDTNHFKGNYPDSVVIEGISLRPDQENNMEASKDWNVILPAKKLGPHRQHFYDASELTEGGSVISHVRIQMFPDGGISRLRMWGLPRGNQLTHSHL